jgi:hypothetical protein
MEHERQVAGDDEPIRAFWLEATAADHADPELRAARQHEAELALVDYCAGFGYAPAGPARFWWSPVGGPNLPNGPWACLAECEVVSVLDAMLSGPPA